MLKYVLKQGFTKRTEVTRQLIHVQRRGDLIIAPFVSSFFGCSLSVKYNEEYTSKRLSGVVFDKTTTHCTVK